MKNLAIFVLFFVTTVCSAQIELEGNKEGIYRVKKDAQEWAPSGITAEPKAIEHINSFSQAINNPGTPILVEQSEKILKLKSVFKKLVEVKEHFIVYNDSTKTISYLKSKKVKENSSYLILFSIMLLTLMILSNILYKKNYTFTAFVVSVLLGGLAIAFTAISDVTFVVALITALMAFNALLAAFTVIGALDKSYKLLSKTFYILMAIHFVLLFI